MASIAQSLMAANDNDNGGGVTVARLTAPLNATRLTISLGSVESRRRLLISLVEPIGEGCHEPRRAAQVIAFFALHTVDRSLDILKAMKLVYLGDRESIRLWGEPILDEPRRSLKRGPVNMTTLAYASGCKAQPAEWSRYLRPLENGRIAVRSGITLDDLDELSRADVKAMDRVCERVGWMSEPLLCQWTQDPTNVPEWQSPEGARITLSDMMRAVGLDDASGREARFRSHGSLSRLSASTW